ncbi:spore germination cell wall hydrolase CwlJ-like protein [Novosphingobium capsulatum]|uniref:Spore germination cell wall hydrolase CwlJ-like protein n=1 Tax=Novosphingobium capsulatum TaxID=13688 RepID=A0ABU1MGE7_9SPHN|nr:cell wall hydrolase [Novosphingobium capsulatum]MDR6509284.1 spore germination cell wall hydrolase CwlJ-like protein [Novosphingobium capsulatum]
MASLPLDPPLPLADPAPDATIDRAERHAELALRAAIALLFLVALAAALRIFAPGADRAALRLDLASASALVRGAPPPALPDPAALLDVSARDARASNAAVPIAVAPVAAAPFAVGAAAPAALERARDCLAAAAWYEAGDDPSGERAVVQVVLNRARHPAFAGPGGMASVCGVVFQGSQRQTGCQFSFTCDGSLTRRHPGLAAWARARAIAGAALAGAVDPRVGWATHYHADYVVPKWRDGLAKLAQLGAHLFYRWPGWWGTGPAFRLSGTHLAAEPVEPTLAALSPAHDGALAATAPTLLAGLTDSDEAVTVDTHLAAVNPLPGTALRDAGPSAALAPGRAALMALHGSGDGAPANTAPIRLAFDAALFPGRYAIQALEACGHRPRCIVLGWRGAPGSLDTLAFAYRRNRDSGGEGAWWDCILTPRTDRAQCLPPAGQRQALLTGGG